MSLAPPLLPPLIPAPAPPDQAFDPQALAEGMTVGATCALRGPLTGEPRTQRKHTKRRGYNPRDVARIVGYAMCEYPPSEILCAVLGKLDLLDELLAIREEMVAVDAAMRQWLPDDGRGDDDEEINLRWQSQTIEILQGLIASVLALWKQIEAMWMAIPSWLRRFLGWVAKRTIYATMFGQLINNMLGISDTLGKLARILDRMAPLMAILAECEERNEEGE